MTTDHQIFTVERDIKAKPATVYRCWTDPKLKKRWFTEMNPPDFKTLDYAIDPAVNGLERAVFSHSQMGEITYEGRFLEFKVNARIVYAYIMEANEKLLSASLSTVTISEMASGSRLTYTEQVTFLDGGDTLATRVPGTETMLDRTVVVCEELETQA